MPFDLGALSLDDPTDISENLVSAIPMPTRQLTDNTSSSVVPDSTTAVESVAKASSPQASVAVDYGSVVEDEEIAIRDERRASRPLHKLFRM